MVNVSPMFRYLQWEKINWVKLCVANASPGFLASLMLFSEMMDG